MALLDALEDLLRMGRDEDAYEQIKEEKGISSQILLNEGIFYGISADYDLSIAYLKLAVKIAEDEAIRAEIWHGLAVSYNNRGTTYRDLTQQEMVGEEAILAEILRPQPMSYNNQGDAYRDLKQPEKAIEDYNKAIKLDPRYARAYYNRGNAYRDLKEPEKAIEDYNKAIELNPGYATAYNNRGISYRDLKQPEKAIEDYNKAIELDPRYAAAYNNRGTAHLDLKQPKKAIEDYNKAIELNFRLAPAYANRGITRLLANVAIGGAIADFKEVRAFFDGANRERMLGFIQWAEARKAMNRKNWADFRAKLAEARVIFEKTDNPLSQSLDAFVELSYIDEKLDGALKVPDAIEASKQIEAALKTLPTFDEEIDPERTIFSARIASFVILQEFISSLVHFEENTDLGLFEANLDNLLKESEKVEETFKSVNFIEGKKSIVMLQNIISLVRQEVDTLRWAADKKQKVI
jgi:tetratricopeptide (TPR) repeat protein